jgi:uncharacterized protein YjiS (DUF1127 family)
MYATATRPFHSRASRPIGSGIRALAGLLESWRRRREFRGELSRLLAVGSYMAEDIGLTRAQARAEAAKPFWRA